jgi:hypothetical protein
LKKLPTNASTYIGTAFTHFQAMSIMYSLVKQYVIDARNSFLATSDVSSQMKDSHLFDLDTNSTLNDFYSSISNNFIHTLEMFNGFTQASGLISVYSTNWNPYFLDLTEDNSMYFQSQSYGECDCAISSSCIQNSTPNVVGCSPVESLLQSTLECLYDQLCINQMCSIIQSPYFPKPLDKNKSRFPVNSSIQSIVAEMFIELWFTNISYENYFEQCHPNSCSYTFTERSNLLYVLTNCSIYS